MGRRLALRLLEILSGGHYAVVGGFTGQVLGACRDGAEAQAVRRVWPTLRLEPISEVHYRELRARGARPSGSARTG